MHSQETDETAVSLAHRLLVLAKLAATTLAALATVAKAVGLICAAKNTAACRQARLFTSPIVKAFASLQPPKTLAPVGRFGSSPVQS